MSECKVLPVRYEVQELWGGEWGWTDEFSSIEAARAYVTDAGRSADEIRITRVTREVVS